MSKHQSLNPKIKALVVLLLLIFGVFFIGRNFAPAQHGHMTPVISEYFKMVFAGDLSNAQKLFEDNPDDFGTKMLRDKFNERFITETSNLDLSRIEDDKARRIAELFQAYWRDALMGVDKLEELDHALLQNIDHLLMSEGFDGAFFGNVDEEEDQVLENVEIYIRSTGLFALSGRTPPLLELMIWTTNETYIEAIELTDGIVEVPITDVTDFISYGWSNFSAFGMTSTGGWAKKDGLYCLCGHYDKESDRYQLSFLKHEGRHFKDFQLYPELEAPDMEYRGKLSELAYSSAGIYDLMAHFTNSAQKIDNAPHPLANWHIVDGFSRHLLDGRFPSDAEVWKSISKDEMRRVASLLLAESDQRLFAAGAATTTGFILP